MLSTQLGLIPYSHVYLSFLWLRKIYIIVYTNLLEWSFFRISTDIFLFVCLGVTPNCALRLPLAQCLQEFSL